MNLFRYVKSIGLKPLVCGNIKELQDPYRNPTTQAEFANLWGQAPHMVTSFADGTKILFEQAIVANATGMQVSQPGMIGHNFTEHIDALTQVHNPEQLKAWGASSIMSLVPSLPQACMSLGSWKIPRNSITCVTTRKAMVRDIPAIHLTIYVI